MSRSLLIACCAAASTALPASAQETVQIREWPVPWEDSRPRDPYVGPEGRIWFVGQRSDYVAVLDPNTGTFEKYDLEAGAGPHNLIVDANGQIWYAGNRAAHIGRLDPKTRAIQKFAMPDTSVRDPHTLVFGPGNEIWFTAQGANHVGRLDSATGEVRLIPVPTPRARPYGIVVDASGRPWLNELGSNKIATVDPVTLQLEEIPLPRADARTRRIGLTSDGAIWYVDYAGGYVGRLDPKSRQVKEWLSPGGAGSRPYAMTTDDRGRVWFVETGAQPNRLVGFDPATEKFFSITPIPSGGGTVRHMVYHPETRSIWFGADTNTIGRALIP